MNYLKYNKILDKIPLNEELPTNTLTIRIEGNIGEDCPSDMHRYDITLPAKVGNYVADFSSRVPKHKYAVEITKVSDDEINIVFNEKDYVIHEGKNFLFEEKEYQASYDGPWFTGKDELWAIWIGSAMRCG